MHNFNFHKKNLFYELKFRMKNEELWLKLHRESL